MISRLRQQLRQLPEQVLQSNIWRSIFRQGYPDNDENRSLVVMNSVFLHFHPVKVKTNTLRPAYTLGLGIMSLFLFLILIFTGGVLTFLYLPTIEQAYVFIQELHTSVPFGALMRNAHRWAAHLMVLAVFLHMMRVFYTGGYKHPREFNWVLGVILLVITFLLSFTGYLLPWDQLSFWAITVGTNIAGYTPFMGAEVRAFLLGSTTVGGEALLRFYVLHVVLLPALLIILLGVHFWRIRKDGGLSAPLPAEEVEK
ncbi:MAG: cytochrome b N-terminal domain-containing protein [Dehalococcoidia bacterium]|jgi:quinol-cytochrome oxidoreductase complex cytochrome b subunit|nr:cytochrome b N-terminal domain-containing protein [Dehalococcoidia bacterium]MDP6782847.1 cytochrome b N-terminal domain-containing protein [Dehalococcoidia bacterium]